MTVNVLEGELLSAQPTVTGAELAINGSLFPVHTLGRVYGVTGDELLNLLNPEAAQQAYTADATLTANDIDLLLTNYLAAGLVALTLPQAEVGQAFSASRQTNQPFRLKPYGAQKFLGGDPSGYLEILDFGDVAGYCYVAGEWTIYAESHANVWRLENGYQGVARALGFQPKNTLSSGASTTSGSKGFYTNPGATGISTVTLKVGEIDDRFVFYRDNPSWPIRVLPQGSDYIGNANLLQYLELLDDNMMVVLRCDKLNHWTVEYFTGVFTYDTAVSGRTFYIDPAGNDSNAGLVGSPRLTFKGGTKLLRPGDTLSVNNGTYTGYANNISGDPANEAMPKGEKNRWITVKATSAVTNASGDVTSGHGGVKFTSTLSFYSDEAHYNTFNGLIFNKEEEKNITGQYLKFLNCGFRGGDLSGNKHTVVVGGGTQFKRWAKQVLFENCWAWGPGGRNKFLAYNADGVIFRRCVARWDEGWLQGATAFQANDFVLYDSSNSYVQNCISIDSLRPTDNVDAWIGSFISEYNYNNADNQTFEGCIGVNNLGRLFSAGGLRDGTIGNPNGTGTLSIKRQMRTRNLLVTDMAGGKIGSATNPSGICVINGFGVRVANCTVINLPNFGYCFFQDLNTRAVDDARFSNCVAALGAGGGNQYQNITAVNSLSYANVAAAAGAGATYLPRADAGSAIELAYAGAQILYRIGEPGTLQEDPGSQAHGSNYGLTYGLWPFPNEAAIKLSMSAAGGYGDADRAWTAGGLTLTQYIWGILGTAGPP